MFQKLGDALRRFMYGRYGADSLNKWLLIFAVVLMLVGGLGSRYLAPCDGRIRYAGVRAADLVDVSGSTRATLKRAAEKTLPSSAFSQGSATGRTGISPVRAAVRSSASRVEKGGINIRCPKCGEQFIKKT